MEDNINDYDDSKTSPCHPKCPCCGTEPAEGFGAPFDRIVIMPNLDGHSYSIVICDKCQNVYGYIRNHDRV